MKENLLSIIINTPIENLFSYTIDSKNTNKWIDFIEKEWIEWEKIEIWTIYKNNWTDWNINSYKLVNFEKNKIFHLKSLDSTYEVIYFYNKINDNKSILNYYEFMSDSNQLPDLFKIETLRNLKNILENK